jgi:hypothetical protein
MDHTGKRAREEEAEEEVEFKRTRVGDDEESEDASANEEEDVSANEEEEEDGNVSANEEEEDDGGSEDGSELKDDDDDEKEAEDKKKKLTPEEKQAKRELAARKNMDDLPVIGLDGERKFVADDWTAEISQQRGKILAACSRLARFAKKHKAMPAYGDATIAPGMQYMAMRKRGIVDEVSVIYENPLGPFPEMKDADGKKLKGKEKKLVEKIWIGKNLRHFLTNPDCGAVSVALPAELGFKYAKGLTGVMKPMSGKLCKAGSKANMAMVVLPCKQNAHVCKCKPYSLDLKPFFEVDETLAAARRACAALAASSSSSAAAIATVSV